MRRADYPFRMSMEAYRKLHADARAIGVTMPKYFRSKAAKLVRTIDPKFNVPGEPLLSGMSVHLPTHVFTGLEELCSDLGVPFDTAGELVATAQVEVTA